MKICVQNIVLSLLSLPILLVMKEPTPNQQTRDGSMVTSPRPLVDAARRLQETYGKVVTYEEPVLTWRGELEGQPGRDPQGKWALFPKAHTFFMPTESTPGTDLANVLENTIAAYHQQTSGTRFHLLSSRWGYHIVPVQVHDEDGRSVPTTSALDQIVTVSSEARTASQHLRALGAAISRAASIHVDMSAVPGKPGGFDIAFRAQPEMFPWGVSSVVARDALIDLLSQSATTFSWHLMCQASAQASDRLCALNLRAIEVAVTDSQGKSVTDSQGKPAMRVLWFDRCRDCSPPEDR